jgi:seryl-tRNA synthetase
MSELKTVFNKLYKTELASQKVELALTDDIIKLNTSADSLVKELQAAKANLKNADNAIKAAKVEGKKVVDASDKKVSDGNSLTLKIADAIEKADALAKDLGVSSQSIPGYSNANKNYQNIEKLISEINGFVFSS